MNRVLLLFLWLIIVFQSVSPASPNIGKADWETAKKWLPMKIYDMIWSTRVVPKWISGSEMFWYSYSNSTGCKYWFVDPGKKEKKPLFNQIKLANALYKMTGQKQQPEKLELKDLDFHSPQEIEFTCDTVRYEYSEESGQLKKIGLALQKEKKDHLNVSPDGSIGVFVCRNNLYLKQIKEYSGKEVQISFEGKKGVAWGNNWDFNENEESGSVNGAWSPDSRYFCVVRADLRKVRDILIINHLNQPYPSHRTIKYPYAEDEVPQLELWVYDRQSDKLIRLDVNRWPDQELGDLFLTPRWWSRNSKHLYFTRRSRDYRMVDLCMAELPSGNIKVLIEERMNTQVYLKPLVEIKPGKEILWWSMRSGWGHYYRYNISSNTLTQVTKGTFNVNKIEYLNEEKNTCLLNVNSIKRSINPYYHFLYSVSLEGGKPQCLTPENAYHNCKISPAGRYFVDNLSRVDLPYKSVLRDTSGNLIMILEEMDSSGLRKSGWQDPVIFNAKASDGKTDLWGVMYKPFNMIPGKKYPVITRGYPGKFDEFIPHEFWPVQMNVTMAQLGFIMVRFGNLGGSMERGLEYRTTNDDQLRDHGVDDKKVVIEHLAKQFDFIDLDRVGIFGGSSGGLLTLSAMLKYPDFFKVGVAMTTPCDPNLYMNMFVERYKGVRQISGKDQIISWKSTRAKTNLEDAGRLKGKLMMIYGTQDDNVHLSQLFRMADAFVKAKKRFDMFIVPGAGHGLGGWRYLYSIIYEYFATHLLGDERDGSEIFDNS